MRITRITRCTLVLLQLQTFTFKATNNYTSTQPQEQSTYEYQQPGAAANLGDINAEDERSATEDHMTINRTLVFGAVSAFVSMTLCCLAISYYACYMKRRKASCSDNASTATTIELSTRRSDDGVDTDATDDCHDLKLCVSAGSASASSSSETRTVQGVDTRPRLTLHNYNSLHSVISDPDTKAKGLCEACAVKEVEAMVKNLSLQEVTETQRSNTLSVSYSFGECISPAADHSTRARRYMSPTSRSALKMPTRASSDENREIFANQQSPRPPPPPQHQQQHRRQSSSDRLQRSPLQQYNHGMAIPEVLEVDGNAEPRSTSMDMALHAEHEALDWLPLPPKMATLSHQKTSSATSSAISEMTYMTASTLMTMDMGTMSTEPMQREITAEMSPSENCHHKSVSSESCHLRLVPMEANPLHATVSAEVLPDDADREKTPETPVVSDTDEEMTDDTSSWMSGAGAGVAELCQKHDRSDAMNIGARPPLDNLASGTTEYDSTTSSYSSADGLFEAENERAEQNK